MRNILFVFSRTLSLSGDQQSQIIKFLLFMVLLVAIVIFTYIFFEFRHRRNIRKNFRKFAENHCLPQTEMRSMPRVSIPDTLKVFLTLTGGSFAGQKAQVLNISAAGFGVRALFSTQKLPPNSSIPGAVIQTPINRFVIREIKSVRLENRLRGQTLGIQIEAMDEDEFKEMIRFITYLKEFLHHGL
jgi:hypothetical protein